MNPLKRWLRGGQSRSPVRRRNRLRPGVEGLETRVVLYSASGNAWPDPQTITLSFMPDGTQIGGGYSSNLFSTFNNTTGLAGKWQGIILQAAQAWAQQTNINFVVVPDDGAPQGSGSYQQGDPGFGDIRIGGFNFGTSTLAMTYQPPPVNNYSIAGDVAFNTGQHFHNNTTYDLYTVAMHEIGHALGLNESSVYGSVMYASYTGVKKGLTADDISGIQSIYSSNGPRTPDSYNSGGMSDGTAATASQLGGAIDSSTLTALLTNLDITKAGQAEYFAFTAPAGSSTLRLSVQSSGLSLLAPKVTVLASDGKTVLASATAEGQYQGADLAVSVPGLVVGQTYYVEVQGADNTATGTGRYALGMSFNGGTPPTEASPIVEIANGNPTHFGGGQAQFSGAIGYDSANPSITGITPDNGVSSQDGITDNPRITVVGQAPAGDMITVYANGQALGQAVVLADNTWTFDDTASPLPDGDYLLTAVATDNAGYTMTSSAYEVVIDTHVPVAPSMNDVSPDNGYSATDGVTDVNTPTFSGTTEPFAIVNLYANGSSLPFGTTEADIQGNWSYTVGQSGHVTYPGVVTATVGALLGELHGGGQPLAALPDGTYQVTATATDVAGTTGPASSPMTVVVDTKAPPPPRVVGIGPDTGWSGGDGVTTAHNITIMGTAQAGDLVTVFLDGTAIGTTSADLNGSWAFDDTATTLPDGTYSLSATDENVAGDVSGTSGGHRITIETVPTPSIGGIGEYVGHGHGPIWGLSDFSIAGTAGANDLIEVYLNGSMVGRSISDAQGNWGYLDIMPSGIPDGTYDFSVVAIDSYGNASAGSPTFPMVVGSGPTAGAARGSSGMLPGSSMPGSLVAVVDGALIVGVATADASGAWLSALEQSKGHHTILVDAAGGAI